MNKEMKIGLVIIFVLVVAFAAVLGKRLYNSHVAEQALTAENKGEEKPGAMADMEKATPDKAEKTNTAIAPAGPPTVVAATTVSDKPPQSTAGDEDQWSTASDAGKTRNSTGSASSLSPPPSFMPEPPKANAEDRYDRRDVSAAAESPDYRNSYRRGSETDSPDYRYGYRREETSALARAGRTYVVAEGDSLFDIARCELGKATRWVEIYNLNIDTLGKDFDFLEPGIQIVLPGDSAQHADPLTRRSTIDYR